jgi:hypothetical protein
MVFPLLFPGYLSSGGHEPPPRAGRRAPDPFSFCSTREQGESDRMYKWFAAAMQRK